MAPTNTTHARAAVQADELLTTEAAAVRVGLSPVTLKVWRWKRNPHAPPHITVGARTIRYSAAVIDKWLTNRTHTPGRKARTTRRPS